MTEETEDEGARPFGHHVVPYRSGKIVPCTLETFPGLLLASASETAGFSKITLANSRWVALPSCALPAGDGPLRGDPAFYRDISLSSHRRRILW